MVAIGTWDVPLRGDLVTGGDGMSQALHELLLFRSDRVGRSQRHRLLRAAVAQLFGRKAEEELANYVLGAVTIEGGGV
jgi:hypothetical protein